VKYRAGAADVEYINQFVQKTKTAWNGLLIKKGLVKPGGNAPEMFQGILDHFAPEGGFKTPGLSRRRLVIGWNMSKYNDALVINEKGKHSYLLSTELVICLVLFKYFSCYISCA
jgi:hypothetical protein